MANTDFKKIFNEGYTITRENGEQIELTPSEIHKISELIDACLGAGSVEYYMEDLQYDIDWYKQEGENSPANPEEVKRLEEKMKVCENFLEDERMCCDIWNDYWEDISYDTGCEEKDAVEYAINEYLRNI